MFHLFIAIKNIRKIKYSDNSITVSKGLCLLGNRFMLISVMFTNINVSSSIIIVRVVLLYR